MTEELEEIYDVFMMSKGEHALTVPEGTERMFAMLSAEPKCSYMETRRQQKGKYSSPGHLSGDSPVDVTPAEESRGVDNEMARVGANKMRR